MRAFAFKSRLNQSEKEKSVQGLDGSVQGLDRFLVMLVLPYTFAQKKQTSMSKKEVVISNSRLNSYGFRVLTEGIDLTQYKRNPILLWMHNRPWRGTKDEVMPLGIVENLRIEGDNLIGTPVFDEKDEFAMKVKAKWDAGIYRMVSAGLDVIEHSNDPSVLLPGQTRSTITKSKLREVSIVDLGANDDALQLYFQGEVVNLSQNEQELSFLKPVNNHLNSKEKMKKIALKLGLAENATEAEVLDAISAVVLKASKADSLQKEVQLEPKMALDGGEDGYVFYRVLCGDWHRYLKNGGIMAFECGENQAEYICDLFDKKFFTTEIRKDFNGTDRFVIGRKKLK